MHLISVSYENFHIIGQPECDSERIMVDLDTTSMILWYILHVYLLECNLQIVVRLSNFFLSIV